MNELTLADLGLTSFGGLHSSAEHAQMLAATLDASFDPTKALPLLWHWAYFNPVRGQPDWGPTVTQAGEPVARRLPRRMWVGGEVRAEGPLRADTAAVRRNSTAQPRPQSRAPPASCWS